MKTLSLNSVRAFVIVIVFAGMLAGICAGIRNYSSAAVTQAKIDTLCHRLMKEQNPDGALEEVLDGADRYPSLVLFSGAAAALRNGRLEDSGFLFYYAAKQRMLFDKACFPPKGEGGNSPFTLVSALSMQTGSVLNSHSHPRSPCLKWR